MRVETGNGPGESRRLRDRMSALIDRHGDDYLREKERLLQRVRSAMAILVTLVGVAVATFLALIVSMSCCATRGRARPADR